jgi:hypothetical protein
MFKTSFEGFRSNIIEKGNIEVLTEFGDGILDNASVNTCATVIRDTPNKNIAGEFFRLQDVPTKLKQQKFLNAAYKSAELEIKRKYSVQLQEFKKIKGSPLSYWVPDQIRDIFDSEIYYDSETANIEAKSLSNAKTGLQTGNNDRFVRYVWETKEEKFRGLAKGGADSWILPKIKWNVYWDGGKEIERIKNGITKNKDFYGDKSVAYNLIKTKSGRRFGYLPQEAIFENDAPVLVMDEGLLKTIGVSNSYLYTYLMLSITTGRHWQIGEVSKLPWDDRIDPEGEVESLVKDIGNVIRTIRSSKFNSPYYSSPLLLQFYGADTQYNYRKDNPTLPFHKIEIKEVDREKTLEETINIVNNEWQKFEQDIEQKSEKINNIVFENFNISEKLREEIIDEIDLRMGEDPRENELIGKISEKKKLIKKILLHFTLKIVQKRSIVILSK